MTRDEFTKIWEDYFVISRYSPGEKSIVEEHALKVSYGILEHRVREMIAGRQSTARIPIGSIIALCAVETTTPLDRFGSWYDLPESFRALKDLCGKLVRHDGREWLVSFAIPPTARTVREYRLMLSGVTRKLKDGAVAPAHLPAAPVCYGTNYDRRYFSPDDIPSDLSLAEANA
jgi:hypothetical protein